MTVWENEVQLQLYARAPAPSRDYYGLTITQSKIILNIWNVSYGPHVYPKRHVSTLEDFPEQRHLHHDIERTFGEYALLYAKAFASRERSLQCLPTKVFLRIARLLATNDILHLAQTSKIFFDICNAEAVWQIVYKKRVKRRVMVSEIERGTEMGWKQALKAKILSKMSLRNLLGKNESWMKQNQLEASTTPNLVSSPKSSNTSITTSNHELVKNKALESKERKSKSIVNLQKNSSSPKLDVVSRNVSGVQTTISLPINKTKIVQNASNLRNAPAKDLDRLLMKTKPKLQANVGGNVTNKGIGIGSAKVYRMVKK